MKDTQKMIAAIVAVIMMMGCALVPFTCADNSAATTGDTDDGTASISLEGLIEGLKEMRTELIGEIDLGNAKLVPTNVSTVVGETGEIPNILTEPYPIHKDEVKKFVNGETQFSKTGCVYVEEGGTLELLPSDADSSYYTFKDMDPSIHGQNTREDFLIIMHNGSILKIMGMAFEVKSDSYHLGLIEMDAAVSGKPASCELRYEKVQDSEERVFSLKVLENTYAQFFEKLTLEYNAYKKEIKDKDGNVLLKADHPDISFKGKFTAETSATDTTVGITASMSGFLLVDAKSSKVLMQGHMTVEKAEVSATFKPGEIEYEGTQCKRMDIIANIEAKVTGINMQVWDTKNKTEEKDFVLRIVIDNGTVQTGKVTLSTSAAFIVTTGPYQPRQIDIKGLRFTVATEGETTASIDSIVLKLDKSEKIPNDVTIKFSGISLTFGDIRISAELTEGSFYILPMDIVSLKANITSSSLKISEATITREIVEGTKTTLTLAENVSMSTQSFVATISTADTESSDADLTLPAVKASIGELSFKGTMGKGIYEFFSEDSEIPKYKLATEFTLKNFKLSIGLNSDKKTEISVTADNIGAKIKFVYDGKERGLEFGLENFQISLELNLMNGSIPNPDKVSAGKFYIKNDMPLNIIEQLASVFGLLGNDKNIGFYAAMNGLGSIEFEFTATNIAYEPSEEEEEEDFVITADSVEITAKNGIRYKELHVAYTNDLKITYDMSETTVIDGEYYGYRIKCGNIEGYYTAYDGAKNSFTIKDGEAGFGVYVYTFDEETDVEPEYVAAGVIKIYSGTATFGGGKLPFMIHVCRDASFSADGLTAPSFKFDAGCEKSGKIVLDTNAFVYPTNNPFKAGVKELLEKGILYRSATLIDEDYIITTNKSGYGFSGDIVDGAVVKYDGFKLTFDLSDLEKGTITANDGRTLPTDGFTGESGFSMKTTSEDKKTGTFTIIKNVSDVTYVDLQCDANEYTLSYENDFVSKQTVKYGATVTITDKEPTKDNCTFLGWSDGSGKIYQKGDSYTMPARDVVLTPVFGKIATPTATEGEVTTLYVDASDTPAAVVDVSEFKDKDWSSITIKTKNASVTLSKTAFELMKTGIEGETYKIAFGCVETDDVQNEDLDKLVNGMSVYAMKLYYVTDSGYKEANYDLGCDLKVTVFIKTDKSLDKADVHYVNQNGFLEEVEGEEWEKVDGGYNVTFTVNHFSLYAVDTTYKADTNWALIAGVAIVVILILAALAYYFLYYKKKQEAPVAAAPQQPQGPQQ